ncbi:IclR family transcriptional regulator domain-containing protein [Microbacterium lushaniae]|uniref:Glycerol operon regulatory protein n=1 Tax=Microbacterium lushaniae TaxID=2614639 RepID=A0A5J5JJ74_9MICO|nr:IclR family transcriptional regulator C-terminal domain-containing protein [Microbacterium lushaniae]KAA9149685.1 helix-turn-helix domain-containing protein [Microbacterium lushaniae]KAA9153022.1 helix-turn-helix domain-containing protein [Microbacterium lushaniae]QEW04393.1 helix-turn-helix domain-containing protein [Microbacterium lushaniae]
MSEERSRDRIQSIERAVQVLRAFNRREGPLSVAEISARVGLARPVVRRILLTFAHLGYTESTNGSWSLTPRILELGSGYFTASSLPEISYTYMTEVVERTGETCSIGVLDGLEVIHVARVEDRRPLPDSVRVGNRLPAHATAIGKVLLAQLTEPELTVLLASTALETYTPRTVADPDRLRERLELVRERGFDVSLEELNPGQVAVAVPILAGGQAIGAIAASSTTVRETEQSLTETVMPVLRTAADEIARAYRNANPQVFRADR